VQYDELNVRVEPRGDGTYEVYAAGETGEATGVFQLPFSDLEVENFILRIGRTRKGTRRLESPEMERARDFGERLFSALFNGSLHDLYRDCHAQSEAENRGLRLKLAFARAPELADIPWEYLYSPPMFLSVSQFTPIVRYLDLPRSRPPLAIELPLRVLAMISAPIDAEALDVDQERHKVEHALRELNEQGLVQVTWLEDATLRVLQQELQRGPYHVFHFVGHGVYDSAVGESVLLFEDEHERGRAVSGSQLGTILADHRSLRLAVLNACEGARTSRDDPFAGVAASLVQYELPAVIAMQFEITDVAAITFAEELYRALVNSLPIDAALAEARKAIYADGNDIEWATPVLFMRAKDGRLFDLAERAEPAAAPDRSSVAIETAPRDARTASSDFERMQPEAATPPSPASAPLTTATAKMDTASEGVRSEARGVAAARQEPSDGAASAKVPWLARPPRRGWIIAQSCWAVLLVGAGVLLAGTHYPDLGSAVVALIAFWWPAGAAVITTGDWALRKRGTAPPHGG
jgi:CHAT domain